MKVIYKITFLWNFDFFLAEKEAFLIVKSKYTD